MSLARKRLIKVTGSRQYCRLPGVQLQPRVDADLGLVAQRKLRERRLLPSPPDAEELLAGRFRLLGIERFLPNPIDWRLTSWPKVAHLWRFHLHYHEFLLDLVVEGLRAGEAKYFQRAWKIVTAWIESNRAGDYRTLTDAWHPFCISRRLPVWIALWFAAPPDQCRRQQVLASMFNQARYLEDHLERDLGGNHLLENARALALIGCFLHGPAANRWRQKAAGILRAELVEQVLPHGEHFERSPAYTAEVLDALVDVRDATRKLMPDLAAWCAPRVEAMASFLRQVLHPDGDLPLLGDCWLSGPALLERRTAHALGAGLEREGGTDASLHPNRDNRRDAHATRAARSRRVGDYWVYRDEGDFFLFDAGPVGPDHLPAHAHADLLSFEASLNGRRLLVDSGVFGYEDDPLRRYCRSSAAHNVLELDHLDQCDLWSRFRMGYRGWPCGFSCGQTGGFHWAGASHNAYRRLGAHIVSRWIACRPGGPWVCVDEVEGRGRHELTLHLHLHPDVVVTGPGNSEVRIAVGPTQCRLRFLTPGKITIAEGWYCPRLGHRRPAPVVLWTAQSPLPAVCGWSLTWGSCKGSASIEGANGGQVLLRWSGDGPDMQLRAGRLRQHSTDNGACGHL